MEEDMSSAINNVERHDLCIVGAGIAGLNALVVASEYLGPDGSIVLVDRRDRPGGMWVDTYDYVRLHQPHPMFTAGNIPWQLDKDPSHLATRSEVQDHLRHCYEVAADRVNVVEMFGWEEQSHEELDGVVRIRCRSTTGEVRVIEAEKLIRAPGFSIQPNDPLELSSTSVHSVSPDHCDMRGPEIAASDAPVWVVGGGKTGMDTAHTLITQYPGREVNLLAGSGVVFVSRDELYPDGLRRWWGGSRGGRVFGELAGRFDGTNGAEVRRWFLERAGISLVPEPQTFFLANLSERENRTISDGLRRVVVDHLEDVVDRDGGTELLLRSGDSISVEPGSWFVNCTGYLLRSEEQHEPVVSESGNVVSINMRAHTLWLTPWSAYFLTHLLFRGELVDAPLYELDTVALRNTAPGEIGAAVGTLMMHNLSVVIDLLPQKVLMECGSDLERWYPWPRRLVGGIRFLTAHRKDREHWRRSLDTFRERHGIAGGIRGELGSVLTHE
jgi:hypothetical protein